MLRSNRRQAGMCYSTHDTSISSYASVLSPKRQMEVESCASALLFLCIGNNSQSHTPQSQGHQTPSLLSSYGVQILPHEPCFSENQRRANHGYTTTVTITPSYYTQINLFVMWICRNVCNLPWIKVATKC